MDDDGWRFIMPMEFNPNDLVTEDYAADLLRIRKETLRNWRSRKRGPPFYKFAGRVYYHPREISAWIASQRKGG